MTIVDNIAELIHRRRRQILVHSILYYNFNENIIDDHTYDTWARELANLQRNHSHIAELVHYHSAAFKDFTHSVTGFNLPLDDPRANAVAQSLLDYRSSKKLAWPVANMPEKEVGKEWLKYHLAKAPYPPQPASAVI